MPNNQQMTDFVISMLQNNLSEFYYYHNQNHTLYVAEKTLEIGSHEQCTEKELELLNLAALWHDTGYTITYNNHEVESCKLARQYLPEYSYSKPDIEQICSMIMATKIPQTPKTKLEEILADADLEYLGTSSYELKSDSLFHELQAIDPSMTIAKWNQLQISFLRSHHYFTEFCKLNREPMKMKYLNQLLHRLR